MRRIWPALVLCLLAGAASAAKIDRIEPGDGPLAGGTKITIFGSGFEKGSKVSVDDTPATSVRVVDATRIEAVTPKVAAKAKATVAVEAPDGSLAEKNDAFSYYGPYDWLRAPGLILLILIMIVLGAPLFLILGSLSIYCFGIYLDWPSNLPTFADQVYALFNPFVDSMYRMITGNEALLAIPFFILSGEIMTAGSIAKKLVNFAKALLGWMPGGLAVAAVGACMFFAAISGSSPVTVIAIGSIMLPALVKEGYPDRFSTGLVTSAGSLGILIPPSIPMIVYAIMVGGTFRVEELFKAGIGPGLVIGGILVGYSVIVARRTPALRKAAKKVTFRQWAHDVRVTFIDGFWALMLPLVILGGIYGGVFSATAAGVVSVGYAYLVEAFLHRDIRQRDLAKILTESATLMGSILIILAFAFAFNYFLSIRKIPDAAAAWLGSLNLGPIGFMLILNGLLLLVGCLMDIMSAIMILAPLIAPMANEIGIDPIHLGIVFIVNLEIGYLTPPIGLNIFVACTLFQKSFGEVMRSVLPFTVVMLGGLLLITYVPSLSVGLGGLFDGKDLYVPFPSAKKKKPAPKPKPRTGPKRPAPVAVPVPASDGGAKKPGKVRSLKELMRQTAEPGDDDDLDEKKSSPDGGAATKPTKVKSLKELMKETAGSVDRDDDLDDDKPKPKSEPKPKAPPDAGAPKEPKRVKSLKELMKETAVPEDDD